MKSFMKVVSIGSMLILLNGCGSSEILNNPVGETSDINLSQVTDFTQEFIDQGITLYNIYRNSEGMDNNDNIIWTEFETATAYFDGSTLKMAPGFSDNWVCTYDTLQLIENDVLTYLDDCNYDNDPDFTAVNRYMKIVESHEDYLEVRWGPEASDGSYDHIIQDAERHFNTQEFLVGDKSKAEEMVQFLNAWQDESSTSFTYDEAVSYCEGMSARLPNLSEMKRAGETGVATFTKEHNAYWIDNEGLDGTKYYKYSFEYNEYDYFYGGNHMEIDPSSSDIYVRCIKL